MISCLKINSTYNFDIQKMETHGAAIQPTVVVMRHVAVVLKQEPRHALGGVGEVFALVHQALHVLVRLALLLVLVQVPALLQRGRVRQPFQPHVILTAAQVIHSYAISHQITAI